ncbi:phosphoribosylformimino-5-aminoimidazole carboxamide ribotide isomerase [Candidatus Methanophagaceae archaeon]|nr:phosphoribosylformimino-5-aminoimidazole carboxamide ribotide isomerase [Methanophagales archaeon]
MAELKPADVYITDLNRLMGTGTNKETLKQIRRNNINTSITVDLGIKNQEDLKEAAEADICDSIILGTETASMDLLAEASKRRDDIVVSVDLFNKQVLTKDERMQLKPLELIKELNEYPIQAVIVLELDKVGTKSGIDFEFLARAVADSEHDIICGGGVRSCEDVAKIAEIDVKGALVATAVHDGAIPVSVLGV